VVCGGGFAEAARAGCAAADDDDVCLQLFHQNFLNG